MNVKELIPLLPLFESLVELWKSQGQDPEAELRARLEGVDAAVDARERAKFGRG